MIAGSLDDVFGACRERQSVLWGTDDFASAGELMGLSPSWLARRERDQLRKSTAIVTVSEELAQRWRARGHDVTVIANGCDAGHYAHLDRAPPPVDVRLKRPIAGFVGHLSDRIDLDLLEALARSGHALLLVGPRQSTFHIQRLDRLLALPNVQWAGPKPFSELPSYLSVIDVGITPYTDTPFNRSSFPLKTLEYLAAGRPVVTTDLPAARGLATELVTIAADAEDFARATSELLTSPRPPDFVERAQAFARRHDWSERTRDMARLLGLKHLGR